MERLQYAFGKLRTGQPRVVGPNADGKWLTYGGIAAGNGNAEIDLGYRHAAAAGDREQARNGLTVGIDRCVRTMYGVKGSAISAALAPSH